MFYVLIFSRGNFDLPTLFPLFGRTQLQVLAVVTAFLLLVTHFVTCMAVKEVPFDGGRDRHVPNTSKRTAIWKLLTEIWDRAWDVPWTIQLIVSPNLLNAELPYSALSFI